MPVAKENVNGHGDCEWARPTYCRTVGFDANVVVL